MEIINEADCIMVELINNYNENSEETLHMLQEIINRHEDKEDGLC